MRRLKGWPLLMALSSVCLMMVVACAKDKNPAIINSNNTTVNNATNGNNATNNSNNTPDPGQVCRDACTTLGTSCRANFLAAGCSAEAVGQLIPGCQQACDSPEAQGQIMEVANLPCAAGVQIVIDSFGLSDFCVEDRCAGVPCEPGSICDPADGMCKGDTPVGCDVTGFDWAQSSFEYDELRGTYTFTAHTPELLDTLVISFKPSMDGDTPAPLVEGLGTYFIGATPEDQSLATCTTCVLINKECRGADSCATTYFATAGRIEVRALDELNGVFAATLVGVELAEVLIDVDTQETRLVEDGGTWCLPSDRFTTIQGEACTRAGANCNENTPDSANFVCAATDSLAPERLSCHATCLFSFDCPTGAFCSELSGSAVSVCIPSNCSSIFASEECADAGPNGGTCQEFENDTFYCLPAGEVAQGGVCAESAECGAGLTCLFGVCQPFCNLNNSAEACPEGQGCLPLLDSRTVGICGESCAGFNATPEECPEGMGCLPLTGGDESMGLCVEVGPIAARNVCAVDADITQCETFSWCVQPLAGFAPTCAPLCDLTAAAPGCAGDEVCAVASAVVNELGGLSDALGICVKGCDPTTLEMKACMTPGAETCLPQTATTGICLNSGDKVQGEACTLQDGAIFGDCGSNTICFLTDPEDPSPSAPGTCQPICLTFSSVGGYASGCNDGEVCSSVDRAWGVCSYDVIDPPLGPFDPCNSPGSWCSNDNSCITIDDEGNALCIPLCRLGDPEGDDCQGITLQGISTSCDVLFEGDTLGACIPN